MAAFILLTGAVMVALGNSSITAAFPVMSQDLRVSPAAIAWVGLAYTLASVSLSTIFGRLADLRGRKRLYAAGIAIYALGVVLCGLSQDLLPLIGGRLVQSVGGAVVNANSVAYLIELYPPHRRGELVGWWEAGIALGQAAGPVVGGLVLTVWGWPAVFFVNLPLCALILTLVPRFMVEVPRAHPPGVAFDLAGAGLFAAALSLLFYGVIFSSDHGLGELQAMGPLLLGAGGIAAFVVVERRVKHPMMDLTLFHNRGFTAGNLAKVAVYLAFGAMNFLLPFYLYRVLELTPASVGVRLTVLPVGMLVASLVFGPLSDRVGTRRLAPAGVVLLVLAALALAAAKPGDGFLPVAVAMVLAGVGLGAFIAPNDSAILSVTPRDRLGVANGIMGVSRQVGMLTGQTLAAGVLSARLAATGGDFGRSLDTTFLAVALATAVGIPLAAVRARNENAARH